MYSLIKPLLFACSAECAHDLTLRLLSVVYHSPFRKLITQRIPDKARTVMGIEFSNPIGLAAGLDKNGDYIDVLASLGFGFIEIGTVTPKAQAGNPKPRMFRLKKQKAIINRLGFNNRGLDACIKNLEKMKYKGVLGINIGKNLTTPVQHAVDDYLRCMRGVYPYASYITINISSPNTPGLRELQYEEHLDALISQLKTAQEKLKEKHGKYVPLALKVAPDLDVKGIKAIAETVLKYQLDGIILTNTTIDHSAVSNERFGQEQGGLSGAPLLQKSNQVLKAFENEVSGQCALIGVGGIMSSDDAHSKFQQGADLVQLYSGLVYRGPQLIKECVEGM